MLDIARCFKYNINSNKGEYTMSKVKNYYWDLAEKAVDAILLELKNNAISKEAAKAKIMVVDNLELVGIDENNVDEVIDMELEAA